MRIYVSLGRARPGHRTHVVPKERAVAPHTAGTGGTRHHTTPTLRVGDAGYLRYPAVTTHERSHHTLAASATTPTLPAVHHASAGGGTWRTCHYRPHPADTTRWWTHRTLPVPPKHAVPLVEPPCGVYAYRWSPLGTGDTPGNHPLLAMAIVPGAPPAAPPARS